MDTEKTFMLHNQGPGLLFSKLNSDELTRARKYVEMIRHLQEIHQLYLMFQYTLDCIDCGVQSLLQPLYCLRTQSLLRWYSIRGTFGAGTIGIEKGR